MPRGSTIASRLSGPSRFALLGVLAAAGCDGIAFWQPPAGGPDDGGPAQIAGDRFSLRSPGPDWTLLEEAAARVLAPEARAGAWSVRQGAAALLTIQPRGPLPLEAAVTELGAGLGLSGLHVERNAPVEIPGHRAQRFDLVGEADGVRLRFSGVLAELGTDRLQWIAWTNDAEPCDAGRCLEPIIDALSLEGEPAAVERGRAAGAREPEVPDTLLDVGADYSLRAGRYENYRWQLSWVFGLGRWRVRAGSPSDAPSGAGEAVVPLLVAEHAHSPWRMAVGATAASPPATDALEDRLAASLRLGRRLGSSEPASIAGLGAGGTRSRFAAEGDATGLEHTLTTVVDGEVASWQLLTGPATDVAGRDAVSAESQAALFRSPRLVAVETRVDSYLDHRLGFAILPPSGWVLGDRTPAALSSRGRFVRWDQGGRWLGVVALGGLGTEPAAGGAAARLLEATLRNALAPLARGSRTELATKLGGQPAQQLSWHAPLLRIDLLTTAANGTAYALVGVDRDGQMFERARATFRFLGPADAPAPPGADAPRVTDPL